MNNKDKLQVCVSFKHTDEEEELYLYTLSQGDKSIFIKNLIRQHKNGYQANAKPTHHTKIDEVQVVEDKPRIVNGKKTKNRFLA